jgi:GGDEF domain-containing protein
MDPGSKRAGSGTGQGPDPTVVAGMPLKGAGAALPPRFERQLQGAARGRRGHDSAWVAVAKVEGVGKIRAAYGDPAAEEFLRGTASVLRSSLRESDKLAPVGREEYGVILDAPRGEDVVAGLERMVHKVRELASRDRRWRMGALTVGVTTVSDDEPAAVLERARKALEQAAGGGAVVLSADSG